MSYTARPSMLDCSYDKLIARSYGAAQQDRRKLIVCILDPIFPSVIHGLVIGYLNVDPNIVRALHDQNEQWPDTIADGWSIDVEWDNGSSFPYAITVCIFGTGVKDVGLDMNCMELISALIGEDTDSIGPTLVGTILTGLPLTPENIARAKALVGAMWNKLVEIAGRYDDIIET
jgi:hypothetical protein